MKFNDITNLTGIIQTCEEQTGLGYGHISGNDTQLKKFTHNTNMTLSKLWAKIHSATGNWAYDDSNQTDLPIATTNLYKAQETYEIPSKALSIQRLEVQDETGNWTVLKPLIMSEFPSAIDEFYDNDANPIYYRVVGNILELFPATNYDKIDGLKMYYDRASTEFLISDKIKESGIHSQLQYMIPLGASLEWLKIHSPAHPKTTQLMKDWGLGLQDLNNIYNSRFPAKKTRLRRGYKSFK